MSQSPKFNFFYWKDKYEKDDLEEFNFNILGLLWLKTKSIIRRELLTDFLINNKIILKSKSLDAQFVELYNLMSKNPKISHMQLDTFIKQYNKKQFKKLDVKRLVSELYKIKYFNWGGDYKNALDKYLIDKYIKVFQSYETLISKLDNEINQAVQGYVVCSWYNHWSSILIEHIFSKHPIVLPAIGKIKKVDFFINNIPFDLKVTYLPQNFIDTRRKEKGLKSELAELKQKSRDLKIFFNQHTRASDIYQEIIEQMKDKDDKFCKESLLKIKNERIKILQDAIKNPKILINNLYEEQGEMRFDSSNRLFLVLVDTEDFDNSWKLKRNLNLLEPSIKNYLDNFHNKDAKNLKINFKYKNRIQEFTALSDIIFIIK